MATDIKSGEDSDHNIVNYVKDISSASASKQKYVDGMKYDYEKVQVEVKMKMDELKKIRESNAHLQDYLSSHKFMMDELHKTEQGDTDEINENQVLAKSLREEMAKLRAVKNEDLLSYEERVASITSNFINGSDSFSQNVLSDRMQRLVEIQEEVKRELLSIKSDLEATRKKFNLEKDTLVTEPLTEQDILRISTEKENRLLASDTENLDNQLKTLGKMSAGLKQELHSLKLQHQSIDN
ncbi:uncharacterized protein LOC142332197 [Lycorma delicatula]|uniref:uncharacterized protein LOC142332197 n=1 Tax=Lycorma delicatula TaxID=130591 RepID=UPI003F51007A